MLFWVFFYLLKISRFPKIWLDIIRESSNYWPALVVKEMEA